VDFLVAPNAPVFSVSNGTVTAAFTPSGEHHWRVAVANTASYYWSGGYMYAHLDPATITVDRGDSVHIGDVIGETADWSDGGSTRLHFAKIRDAGMVWHGDWICTGNPYIELPNRRETDPPFFEPARGTDLLAFCEDETWDYQEPDCLTECNDVRRIFYHTITNTDGDGICEEADTLGAWDTSALPDGDYVVRVEAIDAAGNATVDSMIVTTANISCGVSDTAGSKGPSLSLASANPGRGPVRVRWFAPTAVPVELDVYDVSGRRVRSLLRGLGLGRACTSDWDGSDDRGRTVAPGVYFARLVTDSGTAAIKVVLLR